MTPSISQVNLIAGILRVLEEAGYPGLIPRQFNAVIAAADSIIEALATPERTVTPGMGLTAWQASDQTGLSSKYMAWVLTGSAHPSRRCDYPHDSDDFGRCLGLLAAVPEFRQSLHKMASCGQQWQALIGEWSVLEAMMEAGRHKEVLARIRDMTY
ncbi:hypothetical protein [Candidatus Contendibacter odensensis]|uniref:Uncharacterized protein n=1 Tax=Candidatus Contendobacter odensis Run_B_J11 TaxID=1400861 RepID=A0A7U7GF56_9GAMM|nr:hypothetical protein [Candidatus Contendobacter odensis]CDH46994.1 hypothetical protein BN874_690044 [Candidatus Contendobacter odensis Run_B_J11]